MVFNTPVKIIFDIDSLIQLNSEIVGNKVFVVIDSFLFQSNLKNQIDAYLKDKIVEYYYNFNSNPDYISVDKALHAIREFNATTIIGIGGGSTMDISKFLGAAIYEKGNTSSIKKNGFDSKNKIKSICVPTTAGTGSEVTNVSVFSNYETQEKTPFVNNRLFADVAILDPKVTLTVPAFVTASCGIDTFIHAIEAYWNITSNEISDMFAVKAMDLVLKNLRVCYADGLNLEARTAMMKASLYAGIAFAQTRTTILHAVSFSLTSHFKIPHGLACSILLSKAIRYYGEDNEKMNQLVKVLGFEQVSDLADEINCLMNDLNLDHALTKYGVKEENVDFIAKSAMTEKIAFLGPKEMNEAWVAKMLNEVIKWEN